tara:strand:+ start:13363 stop:13599 length:237 start_codon:yes stop_codon:yes gene_type:complete
MSKRKPHTFTLNEEAMSWFKEYSKKTDRSMSSILNSHILSLKEEYETRSIGEVEASVRDDFRARPYPPHDLIVDLLGT